MDTTRTPTLMTSPVAQAYIIDDDDILLELMQGLISSIGVASRTFQNPYEFLQSYTPSAWECVISDIRMPELGGLGLQRELQTRHIVPPPVIFVTGYADVSVAVEGMKQGAFDFIEKPIDGHRFLEKVQAALTLSRSLHTQRMQLVARNARLALLTPKEREIVEQVLEGLSSRDIAEQLSLSVRTVENHRKHIMDKLRVKSAIELIKLFLQPQEQGH
jgi:FixJ family two-component response regulator